jgi:hypothetical protein
MEMLLAEAAEGAGGAPNALAGALPQALFVLSDMQFNEAQGGAHAPYRLTSGRDVREAYAALGAAPPQLVFWNLRAPPAAAQAAWGGFQARADLPGVTLLSGFSQEMLRVLMEAPDPLAALNASAAEKAREALANARYDCVRKALDEAWGEKHFLRWRGGLTPRPPSTRVRRGCGPSVRRSAAADLSGPAHAVRFHAARARPQRKQTRAPHPCFPLRPLFFFSGSCRPWRSGTKSGPTGLRACASWRALKSW